MSVAENDVPRSPAGRPPVGRLLGSVRLWGPAAAGAVTAAVVWWMWGSLRQVAVIQDEAAYLLQAEIFASGRWTAPGRPLPEFFHQMHVLVTPVLAPKYFPGHALLLVPGIWVGLPGLVPLLLSAVSGGLFFALVRRLAGAGGALVACTFWLTAAGNLAHRASYLSTVTTSALWLFGWWALLEWRETGRGRWLVSLAAAVGWCAITRPLTGLVFAIPVAAVVLPLAARRRTWRDLTVATALGTTLLGLLPLWSARTTGDWRVTPYVAYQRAYFPFDLPGFGREEPSPAHSGSPDLAQYAADFGRVHRAHTLAALPRILGRRLWHIADDLFHGWRVLALPLAMLGLWRLRAEVAFCLATSGLLVASHLVFAHPAEWTAYYMESYPVLAALVGLGLARVASAGRRWRSAQLALGLLAALLITRDLVHTRQGRERQRAWAIRYARLLETIPDAAAVVFVRFAARRNYHHGLIQNAPDLERARVWVVRDRGAENASLLALAPDRVAYTYDEARGAILRRPPNTRIRPTVSAGALTAPARSRCPSSPRWSPSGSPSRPPWPAAPRTARWC